MMIHLATAVCICTGAVSVHAHHSYGMFFDLCTRVTIEGHVENVQWKNPHVWIDLKTDEGTAYRVEWTSLQNLAAAGVVAGALKAGDRVVVTGSPPRDPALLPDPAVNVVSALTQIRRGSDGWSWGRAPGPTPPECARK